jgi:pimeloyl-ACP methyl ester carboxylesterase
MKAITTTLLILLCVGDLVAQDSSTWFERQSEWQGYSQYHFTISGRPAYIVAPKAAADGHPWIWRARFPSYHAEMDVALLAHGYHVAYVDVAGMFGSPRAVAVGDAFYSFLTQQRGLSRKVCLEGVSRGGLFVYNWSATNTDKVACIYCDTPVCDFKSWPGGKGDGLGSAAAWTQCLAAYGFQEQEAMKFEGNPIDHAAVIARAKIPILHIVSENDRVVPPKENTYLLQARLQQRGHDLEVISVAEGTEQSNGHHFDHPQPERVVDFIRQAVAASHSVTEQ